MGCRQQSKYRVTAGKHGRVRGQIRFEYCRAPILSYLVAGSRPSTVTGVENVWLLASMTDVGGGDRARLVREVLKRVFLQVLYGEGGNSYFCMIVG